MTDEAFDLWMSYATRVKDPWVVCQHLFDQGIGLQKVRLYVIWAFSNEKYRRDFAKASEIYNLGLKTLNDDCKRAELQDRYTKFANRMIDRCKRDVHTYLPQVNESKKRSYEQAFGPLEETQEKTLKLPEECKYAVAGYTSGIALLKESIPRYVEVVPDDLTVKDLNEKPQSFVGRAQAARGKLEEISEHSENCNTTNRVIMKSSFANESGFSLDKIDDASFQTAKNDTVTEPVKCAENIFAMLLKSPGLQQSDKLPQFGGSEDAVK